MSGSEDAWRSLTNHVVDLGVHVVGNVHDLRVALVGALREDHLNELFDDIDIGVLEISLLQCSHASVAAGTVRDGISGGCRLFKEIAADGVEAAGVGEGGELYCAQLRGSDWPGIFAETTPYEEMEMSVALDGIVIAGSTVSPSAVTIVP